MLCLAVVYVHVNRKFGYILSRLMHECQVAVLKGLAKAFCKGPPAPLGCMHRST